MSGIFKIETPKNEPVKNYTPGSPERLAIESELAVLSEKFIDIPLVISGQDVLTDIQRDCVMPHNHQHVMAKSSVAGTDEVNKAIDAALKAQPKWAALPWQQRVSIFLKAADLIATRYRAKLNAATMLAQSKNVYQAEIDSACELIDFLRFNAYYVTELYSDQPSSSAETWNRLAYRPLEGFVYAVTPFNFTAIGGNLPIAPAIMGNTVVWKPASSAVYSNYMIMTILKEAGLPDGVINFVPGNATEISDTCLNHADLAGVHFTGSTDVFKSIWKTVGKNIDIYKSYPRLVGETGGKDFIFAHHDVDVQALAVAMVRGAYEYQGQKCSAASRVYLPESIAEDVLSRVQQLMKTIKMGDVRDFSNFVNAVIDRKAFDKIKGYIARAKNDTSTTVLAGGGCDDSVGYFVEPTLIKTTKPDYESMCEEIFGPVLTVYVYPDNQIDQTLELLNSVSDYALTGSIFANNRYDISELENKLVNAAGNFYINDKPTGAVVGQQPFGGARASGTNDKAGSKYNLLRWVSLRTIKENFNPPHDYRYPFMG